MAAAAEVEAVVPGADAGLSHTDIFFRQIHPDVQMGTNMAAVDAYAAASELKQAAIRQALAASISAWKHAPVLCDQLLFAREIGAEEIATGVLIPLVDAGRMPERAPHDAKMLAVEFVAEYASDEDIFATLKRWFGEPTFGNRYKRPVLLGMATVEPHALSDMFEPFLDILEQERETSLVFVLGETVRSAGRQAFVDAVAQLNRENRQRFFAICDAHEVSGVLYDITKDETGTSAIRSLRPGFVVPQYCY